MRRAASSSRKADRVFLRRKLPKSLRFVSGKTARQSFASGLGKPSSACSFGSSFCAKRSGAPSYPPLSHRSGRRCVQNRERTSPSLSRPPLLPKSFRASYCGSRKTRSPYSDKARDSNGRRGARAGCTETKTACLPKGGCFPEITNDWHKLVFLKLIYATYLDKSMWHSSKQKTALPPRKARQSVFRYLQTHNPTAPNPRCARRPPHRQALMSLAPPSHRCPQNRRTLRAPRQDRRSARGLRRRSLGGSRGSARPAARRRRALRRFRPSSRRLRRYIPSQ